MPAPVITGPFIGEGAYDGATFPSLHAWPAELPPFLSATHEFGHIGVAEDIAFEMGEDRSRALYTFNPKLITALTELNQVQYDRLLDWHEDELQAGTARFDVQVAQEGGTGFSWWAAQFVSGLRWNTLPGAVYEVTADLLLLDGPYTTRTAPGLRGTMTSVTKLSAQSVMDGVLRGTMTSSSILRGRSTVPSLNARMTSSSDLRGFLGEQAGRLLEDGTNRLMETGEQRRTE